MSQDIHLAPKVTNFLDSAFDWLKPRSRIIEAGYTAILFLAFLLVIIPVHALIVLVLDIIYPKLVKR